MTYNRQQTKLVDCTPPKRSGDHAYRELLIVEGDSASRSVVRVRDASFQAVLPMQGKPMNAYKATSSAIRRNPWFTALMDALDVGWQCERISDLRYQRILFLFDPDADGIHCGALMLIFFDRYLRPILDANQVSLIKPPLYEITARGYDEKVQAFSDEHLRRIESSLDKKGIGHTHHRYRGLASINPNVLREYCVDPESRTALLMGHDDAVAAVNAFGGSNRRVSCGGSDSSRLMKHRD
ncbi:MAG: toprim domain-containing protein [Planctomycetota bacterium]